MKDEFLRERKKLDKSEETQMDDNKEANPSECFQDKALAEQMWPGIAGARVIQCRLHNVEHRRWRLHNVEHWRWRLQKVV